MISFVAYILALTWIVMIALGNFGVSVGFLPLGVAALAIIMIGATAAAVIKSFSK